jgi:hypothetical protein
MITPGNLPTAWRLLASFNDAYLCKRAKRSPKPLRDWMREAKPLVGIALADRPTPSIVYHMIKKYADKVEAAMTATPTASSPAVPDIGGDPMPTTLPTLPAEIVITLPPVPASFADATIVANRQAGRSPIKDTVATLRTHEATTRAKASRLASLVGVTPDVVELLDLAAHLLQASEILDDAGGYDA